MSETFFLFVCHHYRKELETVIEEENIKGLDIQEYIPVCVHKKSLADTAKTISAQPNSFLITDNCILAQPNQSTGISKPLLKNPNFGNCLQLFVGKELLDYYASDGGFLVSNGWLSVWKQNLHEWGFNQESAIQFFSEFAKRIVLLDSGLDPKCKQNLIDFSKYLELPFEIIPVGMDHFRLSVLNKITETIHSNEKNKLIEQNKNSTQQVADYALAFDLVTNLTKMMNESEAMREIDNTFKMLFSPKETTYISLNNGKLTQIIPHYAPEDKSMQLFNWVTNSKDDFFVNESKDSFFIRISHQSLTLGAAEIQHIAFPQYFDKYLNMALSIAPLFGLAISKARTYQQLEDDEVKLQKLASTDSLTGLFNRRYLLNALDSEFSRSKRYHSPLSAIMMDIDHFKLVNDTYGHAIGDKVLSELAAIISKKLRKSDIAARLGGDEFIVLLPETNQQNAIVFSNRLRKDIENSLTSFDSGPVSITTSMGVAEINNECNSPEDIIHHCDQALYNAKNKGRNIVLGWEK